MTYGTTLTGTSLKVNIVSPKTKDGPKLKKSKGVFTRTNIGILRKLGLNSVASGSSFYLTKSDLPGGELILRLKGKK